MAMSWPSTASARARKVRSSTTNHGPPPAPERDRPGEPGDGTGDPREGNTTGSLGNGELHGPRIQHFPPGNPWDDEACRDDSRGDVPAAGFLGPGRTPPRNPIQLLNQRPR